MIVRMRAGQIKHGARSRGRGFIRNNCVLGEKMSDGLADGVGIEFARRDPWVLELGTPGRLLRRTERGRKRFQRGRAVLMLLREVDDAAAFGQAPARLARI